MFEIFGKGLDENFEKVRWSEMQLYLPIYVPTSDQMGETFNISHSGFIIGDLVPS